MSHGGDDPLLAMFREESGERLDRFGATLLTLERGDAADDAIDALLREVHSIKGAAGMLGLAAAGTIAHAMEDLLAEARECGELAHDAIDPLLRSSDCLRRAVDGEPIDPEKTLATLAAVDRGGAPPTRQREGPVDESIVETPESRSLRVDAGGLDSVVDTVGEAVLHQRRLERLVQQGETPASDELDELLHRGQLRLDDLQHAVIGLRTVPVSSITGPFPRLVRDIAAAAGKEVELVVSGGDTRLDRVVLEGASGAISHLVRNAVAHGIEPPDEREAAGKPRAGRVELQARQHGSRVAITVADDGRGVATGLVDKAAGAASLAQVLAAPGLTGAGALTELSGRGVGLDAVLKHVQQLGGELDVQTQSGRGASFTLLLPISLALLHVLLAVRGGTLFGIPLSAVVEVVEVDAPLALRGRASVEVRGETLSLADPVAVLGGPAKPLPERVRAVVVSTTGARAALVCDELLNDDEVLVRPLGPLLEGIAGYLGAAVVGAGGIALVLDPAYVVPAAESSSAGFERAGADAESGHARTPAAARVLVVDDQFTAREIQRSILEAAGYRVTTARDGREAWDLLVRGEEVELVVTDLEMPEMNGLELVRAIRNDPSRSSLPVIVVTSRGSEDDEREGLEAGADAYVVKQRFDQRALLDTVERLIAV